MIFILMFVIFIVILFLWLLDVGQVLDTVRGTIDEIFLWEGCC
ncbi:MAG: hypothetical protein ACLFTQ_00745 [Candidatus Aenigmatarchaeota archaeon]